MENATISGSVDSGLGNVGVLDTIPTSVSLPLAAAAVIAPVTTDSLPIGTVEPIISPVVTAAPTGKSKGKGKSKTRTPKVEKRGRGRPNVYVGAILQLMLSMMRACHNASLVQTVLTGKGQNGVELTPEQKRTYKAWRLGLSKACDLPVLQKPLTISKPMLGKYAAAAGIEMPKGRPSFAEQANQHTKLEKFVNKKTGKKAEVADAA